MDIVLILIPIFLFCILVVSLLIFDKKERRKQLEEAMPIPSPAPAQTSLYDSWSVLENFLNENTPKDDLEISSDKNQETENVEKSNAENKKESVVSNNLEPAGELVEFKTVESDESEVYKVPKTIYNNYASFSNAFNDPLVNIKDDEEEEMENKVKITYGNDTKEHYIDKKLTAIEEIQNSIRNKVLDQISELNIQNNTSVVENFEDNIFENEEEGIKKLFDFVQNTTKQVMDNAKPMLKALSKEISENFNDSNLSDDIISNIKNVSDRIIGEEISNLSMQKVERFKGIVNSIKNILDNI